MTIIFYSLVALIVLSPLAFGSNVPAAWSSCAVTVAVLTLLWAAVSIRHPQRLSLSLSPLIIVLFLIPVFWALIQLSTQVPPDWTHPIWQMTGDALDRQIGARITLAPGKTEAAVMRLLTYGLVFFLCFQLCRDREKARVLINTIALAGVGLALYGLVMHWGEFHTIFWYQKKAYLADVTSTFINRNSYATYNGLALLCITALLLNETTRYPVLRGVQIFSRQRRIEMLINKIWRPLIGLMLIVTALLSSHSRGGFVSSGIALSILLASFAYKNRLRGRRFGVALAGVLGVTFLAYSVSSGQVVKRFDDAEFAADKRMAVYESTWKAIQVNPWLGYGYGAFEEAFPLYRGDEVGGYYHKAHNTYLENMFGLGLLAASSLFLSVAGVAAMMLSGIFRRRRDWIYPAIGFSATIQVAIHSFVDFSLQIPAVAITYAAIIGAAAAQSIPSSRRNQSASHAP